MARCWIEAGRTYEAMDADAFHEPEAEGLDGWFEASLAEPEGPDARTLVAELEGDVVGFVAGRLEPPDDAPGRQFVRDLGRRRLFVDAIVVAERHRRLGVGRALMDAIEAWGRERGAEAVLLDTFVDSPTSVPFYESGMAYLRKTIGFWKPLNPSSMDPP
jgi:ribosomal protein S18 acetylase RimI-like enzyme